MALGLSGVFRGTTTDFDQKHAFLENRRLAGGSQRSTAECGHSRAVASPQGSKASVCLVLRHVSIRRDIAYPFLVKGSIRPLKRFWPFCRRHMSEKRAHFHSLATSRFKKRLPLAAPAHGVHVTSPPRGFRTLELDCLRKTSTKTLKKLSNRHKFWASA